MQALTASYFTVQGILGIAEVVLLESLIKRRATEALFTAGSATDVQGQVSLGYNVSLALAIGVALALVALAALTYFRAPTWLFWVDLAVLALSGVQAVRGALESPSLTGLLFGAAGIALLGWYLLALVRFGPWARARATAEA